MINTLSSDKALMESKRTRQSGESADAAFSAAAFGDVERELSATRKVLQAVPEDQFDWKPHENR